MVALVGKNRTGRVVGMGAIMILGRFRGADTVELPNVGKVWSTVAGIDNLQSIVKQRWVQVK